jgi:chlorite dismutase
VDDELIYAMYPAFRGTRELRALGPGELEDAAQEIEELFKERADRVSVRGTYSTVGFRADADLLCWWHGSSFEELRGLLIAFRRTRAGRRVELAHLFLGVTRPAEFTPDHRPAFVKGEPPKPVLCVYPFVRTAEWYLLPREERAALLREHGELGREFPDVLANTTSAFGLGDWEWILAFEADTPERLVDCIRRLREARARLYTKEETPFVTGIRTDVRSALADMT